MKRAIYPGSFDPLTLGHLDIIKRASGIVDELVVGVLHNSAKNSLFSLEERVSMIEEMTADLPNVTVTSFNGLLVEHMKDINATIIVRGLRAVTDFEYGFADCADESCGESECGDDIFDDEPAVFVFKFYDCKRIWIYGGDITKFVPPQFIDRIYEKYHIKK